MRQPNSRFLVPRKSPTECSTANDGTHCDHDHQRGLHSTAAGSPHGGLIARFLLLLSVLLVSATAQAQTTAVAGGSPNHIDLAIPVTASVANRCGFTIGGIFTAPDINAGFTHDFEIVLTCNVASRMAVVSANGGLLAPVPDPPAGYARLAPYRATLNLVGNARRLCQRGLRDRDTGGRHSGAVQLPRTSFAGPGAQAERAIDRSVRRLPAR